MGGRILYVNTKLKTAESNFFSCRKHGHCNLAYESRLCITALSSCYIQTTEHENRISDI